MGCDIHAVLQVKQNGTWLTKEEIFDWRNYGAFAFLAGVRNYSAIEPLCAPKGYPEGFRNQYGEDPNEDTDRHSASWLTAEELLSVDYANKIIENRRYTRQTSPKSWDGGATCEKGQGMLETLQSFLGESFMKDIRIIRNYSNDYGRENVRVVFDFDN